MSSTRGFFIGQIVDELASIAHQVEMRSQLGHTDLNRLLEDFFKDILNIIYGHNLSNLNETRSNTLGLDLGDQISRVAFQVTSRANAQKIKNTFKKITVEQVAQFDEVFILVIGKKQGSYNLETLQTKVEFDESKIIDIGDLCRDAITLSMLKLQDLHGLIMREVVRVCVDLEVPDVHGKYPTSMEDFIEPVGVIKRSDGCYFESAEGSEGVF